MLYFRQGKYRQAEPYAAEALSAWRQTPGSDSQVTMDSAAFLAEVLIEERKFGAAEPLAREANQWDEKHDAWGKPDQAAKWRQQPPAAK